MATDPEDVIQAETASEEESPLEELMGEAPAEAGTDLDAAALAAAEQEVSDQAGSVATFADGETPSRRVERAPRSATVVTTPTVVRSRRDPLLKGILLINLALMGVLLAMPTGTDSAKPPSNPDEGTPGVPEGQGAPRPRPIEMPKSGHWNVALELYAKGEIAGAVRVLEDYLAVEPNMPDVMRRLVYSQLSMYAARDGNMKLADDYWRKSVQTQRRSYLPEDLLTSAQRAEHEQDAGQMRAAYARFLLQQNMVPVSQRRAIHDAYLKLGDSYRQEAERGRQQLEIEARERARLLRGGESGDTGSGDTGHDRGGD